MNLTSWARAPGNLKRIGMWVAAFVVFAAVGVGAWRWRVAHAKSEVTYKTAQVEKRRIAAKVTASGTLSAIVTVQVGAQVSGRISKLNADWNSQVKKNELVAELDPALYQAALDQSNANYAQAIAQQLKSHAAMDLADKQYAREKNLLAQSLAAQQDVDAAQGTAEQAHADLALQAANVDQARASLNQAKVNLSYCKIFSPIDGVVISRSVDVGQTVAASLQAPILFTIAQDLKQMQVDTNVSEGDVGRLKEGEPAYFTVDAYPGKRFRGTISQIRNAATNVQNVVTYDAVIKVPNDDLELRPGMTANVTVTYAERDSVLAVPNAALRFRPPDAPAPTHQHGAGGGGGADGKHHHDNADEMKTIYVVHGDVAKPVQVHAGLSDGSLTEIVDSVGGEVHEGDAIAIDTETAGAPASSAHVSSPFGGGGGGGRRY